MDLKAYRETSLDTWAGMAPGWEDLREWQLETTGVINAWLVDRVDPQRGQTILDGPRAPVTWVSPPRNGSATAAA